MKYLIRKVNYDSREQNSLTVSLIGYVLRILQFLFLVQLSNNFFFILKISTTFAIVYSFFLHTFFLDYFFFLVFFFVSLFLYFPFFPIFFSFPYCTDFPKCLSSCAPLCALPISGLVSNTKNYFIQLSGKCFKRRRNV